MYGMQNLISTFHRQLHKRNHSLTWEHPNMKSKAQIDHILMRKNGPVPLENKDSSVK